MSTPRVWTLDYWTADTMFQGDQTWSGPTLGEQPVRVVEAEPLEPFLGHVGDCAAYKPTAQKGDCDCGLVALLALLRGSDE